MTINDLYEYAKKNGIENLEVEIQHGDDGGSYHGTRDLREDEIDVIEKYESIRVVVL